MCLCRSGVSNSDLGMNVLGINNYPKVISLVCMETGLFMCV